MSVRRQRAGYVSEIKVAGEKRLVIVSGRAYPQLAVDIAEALGTSVVNTDARTFANGEIYARYDESVRGADVFVIQSLTVPINEWLMEQLIMVDALKRASVKRITVVAPFYPYARQDKKGRGREPISARLVADLYKAAGADRIMSVDLHAAQIQGFFDGPVDHLFAMPVLLEHFQKLDASTLTVVSPDMGRVRVADIWSDKLGAPLAIIHKRRDPLVPNQVSVHEIVGDVEGRVCLIVDDLIDTGRTIAKAAEALKQAGATKVIVAATHAVFSDPATTLLQRLHRLRCGDRHASPPGGEALPEPHRPADRSAHRPRDLRGLRRRIRHLDVRRGRIGTGSTSTDPPGIPAAHHARGDSAIYDPAQLLRGMIRPAVSGSARPSLSRAR
jgi:ribose-phosphate pyrophosphokinase